MSPSVLGPGARGIVADETNEILVSAASTWQIATKARLGRLPGAEELVQGFLDGLNAADTACSPSTRKRLCARAGWWPTLVIPSTA
jgi:PIN domain nuclease of toxin-antitoxin system